MWLKIAILMAFNEDVFVLTVLRGIIVCTECKTDLLKEMEVK